MFHPTYMYHPEEGARLFKTQEELNDAMAEDDSWTDTPHSDEQVEEHNAKGQQPEPPPPVAPAPPAPKEPKAPKLPKGRGRR